MLLGRRIAREAVDIMTKYGDWSGDVAAAPIVVTRTRGAGFRGVTAGAGTLTESAGCLAHGTSPLDEFLTAADPFDRIVLVAHLRPFLPVEGKSNSEMRSRTASLGSHL
jgi:hypothetical protein